MKKNHFYEIVGIYSKKFEVIDTANTLKEANHLLVNYKLAYGSAWHIYLRINKSK